MGFWLIQLKQKKCDEFILVSWKHSGWHQALDKENPFKYTELCKDRKYLMLWWSLLLLFTVPLSETVKTQYEVFISHLSLNTFFFAQPKLHIPQRWRSSHLHAQWRADHWATSSASAASTATTPPAQSHVPGLFCLCPGWGGELSGSREDCRTRPCNPTTSCYGMLPELPRTLPGKVFQIIWFCSSLMHIPHVHLLHMDPLRVCKQLNWSAVECNAQSSCVWGLTIQKKTIFCLK